MPPGYPSPPDAFDRLSADFPQVPRRIVATILQSYLARIGSLTAAIEASRNRLADACAT